MRSRPLFILIISLLIITGCRVQPDVPTVVVSTMVIPTDTAEPTATEEIILSTVTPSPVPPTPTEAPTQVVVTAPESIDIQYPFPGAMIASPVTITGQADPTFEQNLIVQLVNENGIISTQPVTINAEAGTRGDFSTILDYSITDDLPTMLQVFWRSPKDGSLMHLNGFIVENGSQSAPQKPLEQKVERLFLSEVRIGLKNGRLELQADGSAEGLFENTLQYALCGGGSGNGPEDFVCGSNDNIMLSGSIITDAPDMGKPGNFSIRHMLPNGQWQSAILVIYSSSAANGLVEHAASAIVKNGP